jgi:hypothetical protein
LNHLTDAEQDDALAHTGLYAKQGAFTALNVQDGALDVSSLNCPGFGFLTMPNMDQLATPETWQFAG